MGTIRLKNFAMIAEVVMETADVPLISQKYGSISKRSNSLQFQVSRLMKNLKQLFYKLHLLPIVLDLITPTFVMQLHKTGLTEQL